MTLTSVPTAELPDRRGDSILRLPAVIGRTGLSKPTIYRRVTNGSFPPPVQLGGRNVGWYASDIDAFVSAPAVYRAA